MIQIQFARFDDINSLLTIPVQIVDNYMSFDATDIARALPNFGCDDFDLEERAYFIQECILLAFHEGYQTYYAFDQDDEAIAEASFMIDGEIVTALELADHLHNLEVSK
jgi:hypothetical protein